MTISAATYRILVAVTFGIEIRATSRKAGGWFRKGPTAREVSERVQRLARRVLKDATVTVGNDHVDAVFAPGAPRARLHVDADSTLRLVAATAPLGPGYHCQLPTRFAPLLEELDFVWTETPVLADVQTAMCTWLAEKLAAASPVRFGVSRTFRVDAPLLSPLGPRDAAWCEAVRADPMRARDVFPWWDEGPGRFARARALTALWQEVPWREPIDDAERELMHRVDEELRAARKADASLELPWHAWRELLANLGIEDEDVEAHVAGTTASPIGYRRHPLDVELSGGWVVTLPGGMVGHWEDDGARFWATDGDRMVDFSSLTADGETDSDRLLEVAPEHHEVIARHRDGAYRGRAETFVEGEVPVVVGLTANAPHVGILTCKGGDRDWALATWRSLRLERVGQ